MFTDKPRWLNTANGTVCVWRRAGAGRGGGGACKRCGERGTVGPGTGAKQSRNQSRMMWCEPVWTSGKALGW